MPELSFPFDSVETDGEDDRVYYSEDFQRYFRDFISNGVYPNPSNGLKVESKNNSMVLDVNIGSAYIAGVAYALTEKPLQVAILDAHMSYNRKDIIVVRRNDVERTARILCIPGTPSASPIAPSITRNSDIFDLKLCEITVRSGTRAISQSDILDTRLDTSVCGMVTALIDSVDTENLFSQYETYLNEKIAEWNKFQQEYEKTVQNQLDTQQEQFDAIIQGFNEYIGSIKSDIAKLQTFDINNLSSLPGTNKTTVFLEDGSMRAEVIDVSDNSLLAFQETRFETDGSMFTHIVLYDDDRTTKLFDREILTVYQEDGSVYSTVNDVYE